VCVGSGRRFSFHVHPNVLVLTDAAAVAETGSDSRDAQNHSRRWRPPVSVTECCRSCLRTSQKACQL
jgi:hypothetical protein